MELAGPSIGSRDSTWALLRLEVRWPSTLAIMEAADEFRTVFSRGKRWADERIQQQLLHPTLDLGAREALTPYARGRGSIVGGTVETYWDDGTVSSSTRLVGSCSIDQVLAQWHANHHGLGEIFDPDQTRTALRAIYRHNFKKPLGALQPLPRLWAQ